MSPTIVLISGANRGIGKALLERYLARPNHIVIAANRDPENASSKALAKLPKHQETRLIVVKIDATSATDAADAVESLEQEGIDHIDLVIANAGVSYRFGKVSEINITDVKDHFEPNVYGVVRLYQATLPLLLKSENPKWVTVGSIAGSIEHEQPYGVPPPSKNPTPGLKQPPIGNAAYGPSKAAVHWYTKRMNEEEEKLVAFVVTPGWVQTDMGNSGAQVFGLEEAPDSVDESVDGMVKLFDLATKETHGGKFWHYHGEQDAW